MQKTGCQAAAPRRSASRRSRDVAVLLSAALTIGAGVAASGSFARAGADAEQSSPLATLPPGLLALEQKMEALDMSSVKVSFHESRTFREALSPGGRTLPGSSGVIEAGFKRHVGRARLVRAGHRFRIRLVRGATYLCARWLAREDGGRPWVELAQPKHPLASLNLGPKLLDGDPSFALLRKTLASATSVTEAGMATVEGKQALQLTATFKAVGQMHDSGVPRDIAETRTLQLFITPNGMPVETVGVVRNPLEVVRTVSDLQAVDLPVFVKAPPKSLTIGERALKRIERRRARRRARRFGECLTRQMKAEHRHERPAQIRRQWRRCIGHREGPPASGPPQIVQVKG